MSFANPAQLKKEGRDFNCQTCPQSVQKIRRCREDKEFTEKDGPIWPMYIMKGGTQYGFCPAKATWDHRAIEFFKKLVLISEMKALPKTGGIDDQDSDIIEILAWFLPKYDLLKFLQKAEMILGGESDSKRDKMPKQPAKRQTKGR